MFSQTVETHADAFAMQRGHMTVSPSSSVSEYEALLFLLKMFEIWGFVILYLFALPLLIITSTGQHIHHLSKQFVSL